MVTLQFIGLLTLAYLVYKYLYLPYVNKKNEQNEEIEKKIGILSRVQKEMRELFDPYANHVEHKDVDDEFTFSYGGWIRLYNRTLHFSSDIEIANFKKKANELYHKLISEETKKAEIAKIFGDYEQTQNEKVRQKEIMYLGFRKNFLEYDTLLKQILPDYQIVLSKQEIIFFLEKALKKPTSEAEFIFNVLSDKKTGLLHQEYDKGDQGKYQYFGETTIETRLEQF